MSTTYASALIPALERIRQQNEKIAQVAVRSATYDSILALDRHIKSMLADNPGLKRAAAFGSLTAKVNMAKNLGALAELNARINGEQFAELRRTLGTVRAGFGGNLVATSGLAALLAQQTELTEHIRATMTPMHQGLAEILSQTMAAAAVKAAAEEETAGGPPAVLDELTIRRVLFEVTSYAGMSMLVRGTDTENRLEVLFDLMVGVILFCLVQLVVDARATRK